MTTLEERQEGLRVRVEAELKFMLDHFERMLKASENGGIIPENYSRLSSFVPHLQQTINQLDNRLPSIEALEKFEAYLEKTILPVKRRLEKQLSSQLVDESNAEKMLSDERKRKRCTVVSNIGSMNNYQVPSSPAAIAMNDTEIKDTSESLHDDFDVRDDTEAAVLAVLCSADEIDEDTPAIITEASESSQTSPESSHLLSLRGDNYNNATKMRISSREESNESLVRLSENHHIGASAPALLAIPRKSKLFKHAEDTEHFISESSQHELPLPTLSRSRSATLATGKPIALRRRASIQVLPKKVEYHCASCGEMYTSKSSSLYNPWWSLVRQACPKCEEPQFPWIDISAETNQITHHITDEDEDGSDMDNEEEDDFGYPIEDADSLPMNARPPTCTDQQEEDESFEEQKIDSNQVSSRAVTEDFTNVAMDTGADVDDEELTNLLVAAAEKNAAEQDEQSGGISQGDDGLIKPQLSRYNSQMTAATTGDDDDMFLDDSTSFAPEPSPLPTASVDEEDVPWPLERERESRATAALKRRLEGTDACRLTQSQASALLDLFHHARHCPGKHVSRKHADICLAAKYVMLHVRDCQGTLPCGENCPFAWCKALKRFLRHVLQCVDQCPVCTADAHRVFIDATDSMNAGNHTSGSTKRKSEKRATTFADATLDPFINDPIPPLTHHTKATQPKKQRRKKNRTRPSFDYWESLDLQHAVDFVDAHIVG